jgi:periplasmic divalent cation tolerance protein
MPPMINSAYSTARRPRRRAVVPLDPEEAGAFFTADHGRIARFSRKDTCQVTDSAGKYKKNVTSSLNPDVRIVLTTIGAEPDAVALARTLVDERLAACVNVLPEMISIYRWKGSVEQDHEHQVVIKTSSDRLPALEARLRQLHPYELPEFLVLDVAGGGAAYLAWVRESVAI